MKAQSYTINRGGSGPISSATASRPGLSGPASAPASSTSTPDPLAWVGDSLVQAKGAKEVVEKTPLKWEGNKLTNTSSKPPCVKYNWMRHHGLDPKSSRFCQD